MWIYSQESGLLRRNGKPFAHCYSGWGEGKNNPLLQNVANVGPIPQGVYWIIAPIDSPRTGKFVLPLVPVTGTITFGRGFFEIHGENQAHPGESSHGCIVASLAEREAIAAVKGLLLVLPPLEVA